VTESINQRVHKYLLDGSDEDLKRLLVISEHMAERARTALRRSGIQAGWDVVECGCGPLGALPVIADLVGAGGRVVGVDASQTTVQRARSIVETLGLDGVDVVVGDVNEIDAAALGGPFDLAYCRLFLMHQPDPMRTFRRIAGLLRPGGWVIAQEPLRTPAPRSFPHLSALDAYWRLLCEMVEAFGVPNQAVERLPSAAIAAGLEVVSLDGSFGVDSPEQNFVIHAATLSAARERAIAAGIATEEVIDGLIGELRDAASGPYEWVTSPFLLELTLRKPVAEPPG
jgi:SAM-dependent methyltransferase